MRKKAKDITIGVPVYNGAKTIKGCIKSILNQSYKNIIILISDNCSEDDTKQICKLLKKKNSKIKIFFQKKKISSQKNFKFLIDKSKTEYFMWLAAHHKISKNFIRKNLSFLKNNKEYSASTSYDYFEKQKKIAKSNFSGSVYENVLKFYKHKWRTHGLYYSIFRTSILKNFPEVEKDYVANDWSVMIKLLLKGKINREKNERLILGEVGRSSSNKPFDHLLSGILDRVFLFKNFLFFFTKTIFKCKNIKLMNKIKLVLIYYKLILIPLFVK